MSNTHMNSFNNDTIINDCAVPEKIHTHPVEGHCKFLRGRGVLKVKILEAKYGAKLKFPGGEGGCKTTTVETYPADTTIKSHKMRHDNKVVLLDALVVMQNSTEIYTIQCH